MDVLNVATPDQPNGHSDLLPDDHNKKDSLLPPINGLNSGELVAPKRAVRKVKKGIFISYAPNSGYLQRSFIVDLVRQLKENNFAEDIWFDKDEHFLDSPVWFSQRMKAAELCQAAIIVLSEQYYHCPVSMYEGKILAERQSNCRLFVIQYNSLNDISLSLSQCKLMDEAMDLSTSLLFKLSVAEKTSIVLNHFMTDLEQFAIVNVPSEVIDEADPVFDGEYKSKMISQWSLSHVQEWLFNIGVKEFYRQNFAESMVDGFLLLALSDEDMIRHLGIDNRIVRKKIIQQLISILEKEHKHNNNWHLRARDQRSRPNTVYLIYDPSDVRLAQSFKQDLIKRGLQVIHHQKLGQSQEEFLRLNSALMATSTYVILMLSGNSTNSKFSFHEVMFADWLGKKIVVCMFKNVFSSLRASLRSVLGECSAIDFEKSLYSEAMDILEHQIRPYKSLPGVVLEQSYLNKMNEGIRPLASLAVEYTELPALTMEGSPSHAASGSGLIFISFQWDMQSKVEDIKRLLEANSFNCWTDIGANMRGHSSISTRSNQSHDPHNATSDNLQSVIQRNMRNASLVLCCVTPKYLQSDNCINDLRLAESLNKPIVPLLMRFCSWPPDGALPSVKRTLAKCTELVELYNDKLYRQNLPLILDRVRRVALAQRNR